MRNLFVRTPFLAVVVMVAVLFATTLAGCDEGADLGGSPGNENQWDEDKEGDNPGIKKAGLYKGEVYIDNYALGASLQYIADDLNASSGDYAYTIALGAAESIAPQDLSAKLSNGNKAVQITLVGYDADRKISLGSKGSLFTVGANITLTLGNKIELAGKSDNDASLVKVAENGTLIMKYGSKISGNTYNTSAYYAYCGGVYVDGGGTFTMKGGVISNNTVNADIAGYGGGVYVGYTPSGGRGTFTMSNGEISGNSSVGSAGGGGGVYVMGTFTMSGNATIRGNSAANGGGGVAVEYSNGRFTMSDNATISENTAGMGGGVRVGIDTTFAMSGGTISGNNTTGDSGTGGGAYVSGTLAMSGGTISGNTAAWGGGVCVYGSRSTFTKTTGGSVYGKESAAELKNTASGGDSKGYAVYKSNGSKYRDTTIAEGEAFDSANM